MISHNKVLSIIPARAGSKRLPGKNIKDFNGKPLISWTIEAALKSKYIDKLILSSDDPEAINIALEHGCEVPFTRPSYLATDEATSMDVIRHAVDFLNDYYDYILLLQPTSPLRSVEDIDAALELASKKKAQVCTSFCALDKPLSWYYLQDEKGYLQKVTNTKEDKASICYPNGAIYIFSADWIKKNYNTYQPEEVIPYMMPYNKSIDIDTDMDWQLAKYFQSIEEK